MTRGPRRVPLRVLLNGHTVGRLRMERGGAVSLAYDPAWLDRDRAVPASLSLPLREQAHTGGPVVAFLENLLPDGQAVRDRIAARVGAEGTDAYSLLEKIGRDCVGALRFVPEGGDSGPGEHGEIRAEPVSDAEIAATLSNLASAPLGIDGGTDFRVSIPGARDMTALLRVGERWRRPVGATRTSHFLKVRQGGANGLDVPDAVENELFCLRFCAAMGADVARADIADFDGVRALVVERPDRLWTRDGRLLGVPQEDFRQALGYPPGRTRQPDGGPGAREGLDLLGAGDDPVRNQSRFLQAQILFWLLGATDGHAGNFSVRLGPGGFSMAPFHGVLSAQKAVDEGRIPRRDFKLAMSVGRSRRYRVDQVVGRHFVETARAGSLGEALARDLVRDAARRAPAAIEEARSRLPPAFPPELADAIGGGIARRALLLAP